jgi:polyphosphate kinase 2 (PPK2 family)
VHGLTDDNTAKKRMKAINDFEQMLALDNNTTILKFYLHVSHHEQRARLKERMKIPQKMWKYSPDDLIETELWNKYMGYYEDVFEHCNIIPWQIIPADQNWYKSYLVASALRKALRQLNMKYPGMKSNKQIKLKK